MAGCPPFTPQKSGWRVGQSETFQAVFGNSFSGAAATAVAIGEGRFGDALTSIFLGGTGQGIPGGGPVTQGAGGVIFTSLAGIIGGGPGEALTVEILNDKVEYDAATFLAGLVMCLK